MDLIPDQCVDDITLREAFYLVVFVPPDPLGKVRGDAGVQGSIAFAGHDIYARLVHVLNLLDRGPVLHLSLIHISEPTRPY